MVTYAAPAIAISFSRLFTLASITAYLVPTTANPMGTGGCPAEFNRGEDYEEGDRVSKDGLVYQCKSGPSGQRCAQAGFEPGISIGSGIQRVEHWKEAWSILGYCSGTITPTAAPAFVSLPDMGGCPEKWSSQSYQEGDRVSSMNLVLECNSWPYSIHCGQAGYEPPTDVATPGAWKVAWTVVGSCAGTIEPTGAPNFDPTSNVGACPEEWAAGSDTEYEEGDIVSVITSTAPIHKVAFKCREWPSSGFCGQFSPTSAGGNLGWIFMGSCDGTFAPTGAPAQFTGLCQYSKCDEENRCTDADVEPWNSRTNYVEGDVIRLDNARFKCREWPYSLWCKQLAFVPTLASDGIWKNAWIANGSCGPTACKLPKLRTNSNNNTGKPYWVQTGQVMTFFDESSSTRRKRYTNEEPTIQDNDQYVVQCDEPGYIPDEMCVYTCTDGALNAKTYCDVANPEDLCVPIREATFSKQCSLDFDSDEPWHDGKSLKQWWGEVLQKYHSQRAEIFSRESDIPFYLGHGAALLAGYGFAAQHFVGGPTPDAEKDFNADAIEITGWVPRTDYAFGNDSLRGSTTVQAPGYIQNLVTVDVMGTPSVTGPIPDFHPEFKIASLLRDYDPCDDSKYLGFPPECFIYHPAGFHTGSGEMIMFRTPLSNGDIDLQGICTVGETIPPVIIPALNSNMANIGATLGRAGGLTGLHPSSWSMHLCVDDDINHPYLCSVHPNLPVMDNGEYVSVDAIPFVSIPTKMHKKLCAERQAIGPDVCTPNLDTAYPYPWTQHL